MSNLTGKAFVELLNMAAGKCFGSHFAHPLSESDCKLFSNQILEQTGLVIGPKSLRNYSIYASDPSGKKENPSLATLDTLARYVANAPRTDEATRKEKENHFPYWHNYRTQFGKQWQKNNHARVSWNPIYFLIAMAVIGIIAWLAYDNFPVPMKSREINESFGAGVRGSLAANGWGVVNRREDYFAMADQNPGHLTLFTLPGDNWNDSIPISNIVYRKIDDDCFSAEIRIDRFLPKQNWQQGGLLLSESADFKGKVLRLSLSYNDFFGGFKKAPEILIQAISSVESGSKSKPEEIAHLTLFEIQPGHESIVYNNLSSSALKIEKKGQRIRFLFAIGAMEKFAYREVFSGDFDMDPRFIGIFSSQGLSSHDVLPFKVDAFNFVVIDCKD
jgi:hypothetical protein